MGKKLCFVGKKSFNYLNFWFHQRQQVWSYNENLLNITKWQRRSDSQGHWLDATIGRQKRCKITWVLFEEKLRQYSEDNTALLNIKIRIVKEKKLPEQNILNEL